MTGSIAQIAVKVLGYMNSARSLLFDQSVGESNMMSSLLVNLALCDDDLHGGGPEAVTDPDNTIIC
jgi:hypothetical protein